MDSNIGKIAGEIWHYLEDNGGVATTFKLKMILSTNNAKLYLGLGWLLREEKIIVEQLDKGYKISIKR